MKEKVLQITAGRGPAECCWVVAQVLKRLLKEAKAAGIKYQVLHRDEADGNGALFSVTIQIEGNKVDGFIQSWKGTIQWIGQSKLRKYHKRKNWFVAVNLIDFLPTDIEMRDHDIKYEAIKSGGPGGQHVNKVNTAIRATHKSSSITVVASDSRSQLQNKKKAKERLLNALRAHMMRKRKEKVKECWQNHNELERGNPVRVFKGSDFKPNHQSKKFSSGRKTMKQKQKWLDPDE